MLKAEKSKDLYTLTEQNSGETEGSQPSAAQAAEYINDMLSELTSMARRHQLSTLAGMMEQAGQEAKKYCLRA